jgi:hypothetical protein
LGERHLKLGLEALGQFLLGEDRVLLLLVPQPNPSLRCHLVHVTVTMVDERFPGRTSLTIALAQLGQVISAETKAQVPAELFKVFSSLQAIEQSFLG